MGRWGEFLAAPASAWRVHAELSGAPLTRMPLTRMPLTRISCLAGGITDILPRLMGNHSGGGLLRGDGGPVRLATCMISFGFLTEGSTLPQPMHGKSSPES